MQDIRRQFLKTSIQTLKQLNTVLQTEDDVSEQFVQQMYRNIHTIKGTAQTFGLANAAKLAHELESILSTSGKINESDEKQRRILNEGFDMLIHSLEDTNFDIPSSFIDKIQEITPDAGVKGVFLSLIPPDVFDQLTEFEKNKIAAALKYNKSLYRLDVVFELGKFSDELKNLQNLLNEKGEIIFMLPGNEPDLPNEIGFQIYLSSREIVENLQTDVKDYNAKIVLQTSTTVYSSDLSGVLSNIVAQGRNWSQHLGKDAKIAILSDEPDLSTDTLKLIFDILLHLVKNSIDHSIEKEGKIEIRIKEENGGLQMIVADDGNGVNLEKVRAKAIEKNLILPDTLLSEQETLELIFLPGFSTAEKVTEISGRGIGLDAVRDMIINMGGTIGIETNKGKGVTFEIFLPIEHWLG